MQPLKSSAGFRALEKRRRDEQAVLIDEARAYAKRLRHDFPDARVFLYGSVARGDFNLSSDIDLLAVAAGLPAEPLERSRCLYRYTAGREEPKGLLPTEFERLQSKGKLWYLEGALEF